MGFFGKVKEGIIKTGKGISAEIERREELRRQKLQILNQLDMNQLKKVCKDYGIGEPLNYDPVVYAVEGRKERFTLTRNHYANHIISKMTLDQIRSIGEKLRVNLPEVETKVEPLIIKEPIELVEEEPEPEAVQEKPKSADKDKELVKKIIQQIEAYKPNKVFNKEAEYENVLYARLEMMFPNIEQQYPYGDTRIDLKIGRIGIEIKKNPDIGEMKRLFTQIYDFSKFFKHIIVVIYDARDRKSISDLKRKIKELNLQATVLER